MKHFFVTTLLAGSLLSNFCAVAQDKKEQTILFKGIVGSNVYDGNAITMYGSDLEGEKVTEQKAVIKNGIFQIKIPFRGVASYRFQNGYELKVSNGYVPFAITVEKPGIVTIHANMKSLYESKVDGSAPQKIKEELAAMEKRKARERKPAMFKKYGKELVSNPMEHQDDPRLPAFIEEYEANQNKDFEESIFALARKYPKSIAIPLSASELSTNKQAAVYALLSAENKKSRYGRKLESNINIAHKTSIGKIAPDFTLPTADGKTKNLKDLLAGKKYLLIDFWASWCMPCRQEFGNMRPLYDHYKDKGLEILGVSTDQSKGSWLGALKDEELAWPQVWDGGQPKDAQIASKLFYVPFLPTTYLLNAKGEIIANNLRGKDLDKKIGELLGETNPTKAAQESVTEDKKTDTASQSKVDALVDAEKQITTEFSNLNKKLDVAKQSKDNVAEEDLERRMMKLSKAYFTLQTNFVKNNPDHPKSYSIIEMLADQLDYSEAKALYNGLSSRLKNENGNYLVKEIEKNKNGAIGQKMMDFTQNDLSGNPINFSAFKGKYVLVDFWASWCGPCRGENPNVLKAYNRFSQKGFTVIGISLDDSAEKWKKAVAEDKMPWTQLSSLNGRKNEISTYYNINGIPANFLVDQNGIIIAKNLRGKELEAKLEEVIK